MTWVRADEPLHSEPHEPMGKSVCPNCKPVVVIDPEDREAVARLVDLLADHGWLPSKAHGLRDALREFANPKPPRPEEPTGLGAVVKDAAGEKWVRVFSRSGHNGLWRHTPSADERTWLGVDAVEVLSEGVPS